MKLLIYILSLYLLTISSTALAQFPTDHVVLVSTEQALPLALENDILSMGGRLAVKTDNVYIARLDESMDTELRSSHNHVHILRRMQHASELGRDFPEYAWVSKLMSTAGDRQSIAHDDGDAFADGHSCLVYEDEISPEEILSAMKTAHFAASMNPNITSDVMRGSTVLAVMYVNNVEAHQQGVATWTESLRMNAHANIMVNLAWWSDQADAYDKTKVFTIRPFWPDNPVCAIDFDPTEGYTTQSFSINDHKFQNPLMDALGYSGSHSVKMRAFCNDLRTDEGTDWAYIAFLLVGNNSVRAHASYGGPSTVLMANSAGNGYVFAHETGHIFNAFDEYYEASRAIGNAARSRFGVPNGNHHFRNYPVMPCMMASNYRALSAYTAVHLGLADSVRYIHVVPTPPDAVYQVAYISPEGAMSSISRFQGDLAFSWGNGTSVRLSALPTATHNWKLYTDPVWNASGGSEITVDVTNATPSVFSLAYSQSNEDADISMEYLTLSNALASEFVQDIFPLGNRSAAFVGQKGISIWNDSYKSIIDHPIGDRGGPVFRQSFAIASGPDNTLYFTSHASEILGRKATGEILRFTGPVPDLTYRGITVTDDGAVWSTDGGVAGGRDMQASGAHRFHEGQVTAFTTSNSPLPSNNILAVAAAHGPTVWIGMGGKESVDQGLFIFDPMTMTLTDHSSLVASPMISRIRTVGRDSVLVISRSAAANNNDIYVSLIHDGNSVHWDASLFTSLGTINDVALDRDGALVVASTQGLAVLRDDQTWMRFQTTNSMIVSNICYSVAVTPSGTILAGTNNGAVAISRASITTSTHPTVSTPGNVALHPVHPNPLSGKGEIAFTLKTTQYVTLRLHDALGRTVATIASDRFGEGHYSFPVNAAGLPAGRYLATLLTDSGMYVTQLVVLR